MKKIFFALIGCLTVVCAHAAQIANIEYVHKMIEHKWDITVPYNPTLSNVKSMANMKYLLTAIDVANEILNGEPTTDYGNGEFATLQVADTTATNQAVETLIKKEERIFIINTLTTSKFFFYLGAGGTFFIDWGDGTVETITQDPQPFTGFVSKRYYHNYSSTGKYTIKISGKATGYHAEEGWYPHAIGFCDWNDVEFAPIESIEGSLGGIFPCLSNGGCPSFAFSFAMQKNLTSIPENLFAGISGAPAYGMFRSTFFGCSGLTSIPENLFGNISGPAQDYMFSSTFSNCTSLNGPSARINGQYLYEIWPSATSDQVGNMYGDATGLSDYACIPTVWGGGGEDCSAPTAEFTLTTTSDTSSFEFSISAAGEFVVDWGDGTVETITKPDTTNTKYSHTYNTSKSYTIGIGGQATAYNTDVSTAAISFMGLSSNLDFDSTGQIASIDGSLGAIFGTLSSGTQKQPRFYNTFYGASNMKGAIPENLFAGISGAPTESMFDSTFFGCSGLTSIPDGLFAGISGAAASNMFRGTFKNCSGLTSIPGNLFGIISAPLQSGMFYQTFYNCASLTGSSALINDDHMYARWNNYLSSSSYFGDMYYNATGLSDYACIPTVWGGGGNGDCSHQGGSGI